jgi:WD40 repeat protein/DNA-binding SARP family transcriptional activator
LEARNRSAIADRGYGGSVKIRFLGPLEVSDGQRVIPLGGRRQRLVLAHLLVRVGQVVPVEVLIDEVWGSEPPRAARASLQSYVSNLRRALGHDRIASHGQGYRLVAGSAEVDALRVAELADEGRRLLTTDPTAASEVLSEALSMWRGAPFADLADGPSLRAEVARLEELRLTIVEDRIDAELRLGHDREVVGELEELTAANPLRERSWCALMLALYRSGRQGEALAAYDRARRLLADELGIAPSSALQRLHEQVLRQDPALEPNARTLKGYQLLEPIGRGRFGVVHRAIQPSVDREVAVKVVPAERANDPAFVRRFFSEAQAVARLEHPHVVPLYDYWREPDGAYLVMRLLRGGTLRERLERDDPLDRRLATRIGDQIAEALAAAHRRGVIHRQVDVDHVLLDEQGNAFLAGFGLTRPPDTPHGDGEVSDAGTGTDLAARDARALALLLARLTDGSPGPLAGVIARASSADAEQQYPDAVALYEDLVRARIGDGATPAPVSSPPVPTRPPNPYKGLRAFTEADVPDFFGREALTARLLSRLREGGPCGRFLAVVGPSGSGKSSVLRAGMIPAVRAGALPGSEGWFIALMTPADDPFRELATALGHVAVEPTDAADVQLEDGRDGLSRALRAVLPDHEGELLLVIDQFEELFTLVEDEELRRRFVATVVDAATRPEQRVRVVVALRADLYDRPLRYPALAELVRARTEAVVPLSPEELDRAVRLPAERVGVCVEPALIAEVVRDVADRPGVLPLLQYALTEQFDRADGDGLTAATYAAIGGVAGALARRAEEVHAGLSTAAQLATRQLFLRLVSLGGEGVDDTRRRVPRSELESLAVDPVPMTSAIEAFGAARLLTFDRHPDTREATVEVAHESLLRVWDRLRSWTDAARDDLRAERRVAAATRDWLAADREPSFLLTGVRLEQVEAWRARSALATTPEEREYLEASVAERDRAQAEEDERLARERRFERSSYRRLRALVAVLLVAALIAGGLTVFGFTQRDRARLEAARAEYEITIAQARELAATAVANLEVDPERSMLLALEAIDRTRSVDGTVLPEAEEALHRAVGTSRIVLRVPGIGGTLSWSPDGDVFVTEGPEDRGVVDIRDATTGGSVRRWIGHDADINDVAFSPDGTVLATGGDDGAVRTWDPTTGEMLLEVRGDGAAWHPSWNPDGSVVAVVWTEEQRVALVDSATGGSVRDLDGLDDPWAISFSTDGQLLGVSDWRTGVRIFDTSTGEEVTKLDGHTEVHEVVWSPDGRWIATGSADTTVRIWDARTYEPRFTLHGHTDSVNGIAWSADSRRLLSGSSDGSATVWDVSSTGAREAVTFSTSDRRGILGVAFAPDGDRAMVSELQGGAVLVFDLSLGGDGEVATFPAEEDADNVGAFVGDGDLLAATAEEPGTAAVWDVPSGEPRHALGPHDDTVTAVAVAPSSNLVTTAGGTTVITSTRDDGEVRSTLTTDTPVDDVAWSPDGSTLAIASEDAPVQLVDRRGDDVAAIPWGEGHAARRVTFSPDGRFLGAVRSPTSRADPDAPMVRIWDASGDEVVATLPAQAADLAFDPTGDTVATAGPSGVIELWDVATGRLLDTLAGHRGAATSLAFSPDGSRLVSGGSDATVRLWDLEAGVRREVTLRGHGSPVTSVAFDPDGRRVASAEAAGVVRVWAVDLDDLIDVARAELTRSLTDEECRRFLHRSRCRDG